MASIMRFDTLQSTTGNQAMTIDASGSIYIPGSIVQVKHARTAPTRYAIATQDISAIPELTINISPKFSNSAILITAMINSSSQHVSTFGFLKNDAFIINNSNTNSAGSILTVYDGQDTNDYMYGQYIEFLDYPATTGSVNYKAAASASWGGSIRTLYINDRLSNDMRSVSSMTVWEIAQ